MTGEARVRRRRRGSVTETGLASEARASIAAPGPRVSARRRARRLLPTSPQTGGVALRRDAIFRRLLIVADLIAVSVGLLVVSTSTRRGLPLVSVILLPLTVVFVKLAGRYDHDEVVVRKSTLDETPALVAVAAVVAVAWALITEASGVGTNHVGVGVLWASTAVVLVLGRFVARAVARRSAPTERVLIVGTGPARAQLAARLEMDPTARTEVVGWAYLGADGEWQLSLDGERPEAGRRFDDIEATVRELDAQRLFIVSSSLDSETTFEALADASALGLKVSILPSVLDVVGSAVEFDEVGGLTVLSVRRPGLSRSSNVVKRSMDLVGATVGLILASPLMLVLAAAIKLDSNGPVFFRQRRVGRGGEVFAMIKFRSMVQGAEFERGSLEALNESNGLFKLAADPRITRVGRVLRRTSIDELPQLINVLKGQMSLVGPRPLVLEEDRLIEGRHRRRLQLAPGMTGPWQVLGPRRPPLGEMVKIDFLYAANWSFWGDIKILVRTLSHVLGLRGV